MNNYQYMGITVDKAFYEEYSDAQGSMRFSQVEADGAAEHFRDMLRQAYER